MTSKARLIQEVTDALKAIAGRGATAERLGVHPSLHGLPGLPDLSGMHPAGAGMAIQRHIVSEGIEAFSGSRQFLKRTYSADILKEAFRLELAFRRPDWSARRRRGAVITLLGTNHSPEYWGRAEGPEWELLYLLAAQLVDPNFYYPGLPLDDAS